MSGPPVKKQFDVAVLGGGPAGTATALALNRLEHSVVVIEQSNYESVRLGETLPPGIRPLLAHLGVWEHFLAEQHLPSFGIHSAWGRPHPHENDFIFNPYGSGWHVDRARFDALLARRAEQRGVNVCCRTRVLSCHEPASGGWEIQLDCAGQPQKFSARCCVDATGRLSAFACRQGAKRVVLDHLVGVVRFLLPRSESVSRDRFTLLESVEEGWWYSALLPDGRAVAAYMTDGELLARGSKCPRDFWASQLRRTNHTRDRLRGFTFGAGPLIVAANSVVLDRPAGSNWLAVGDAACSCDPLSSQGVFKALDSGIRAARAIHEGFAGDTSAWENYAGWVHEKFDQYLHRRAHYYSAETRWRDSPFWHRRQPFHSNRVQTV